MVRFFKRFVLVLVLAAFAAAAWVLWNSPDPSYTTYSWLAGSRYSRYDQPIADVAQKHGLDPLLVKAIVWRESAFHPDKLGTVGERGLMQVGEAAATDWARAEKIETFMPTDLFDPHTNLCAATWHLARSAQRWKDCDRPDLFALAEFKLGSAGEWPATTTSADLLSHLDPDTRAFIQSVESRRAFYARHGW
jgi:soluble lytic murein transglycosylase